MKNQDEQKVSKKAIASLVFSLLGLLLLFVAPRPCCGYRDEPQEKITCTQMGSINNMLETFKLDNNVYPTTQEGLEALVKNPNKKKYPNYAKVGYTKKLPKDSWGANFLYVKKNDSFIIVSYGSDRRESENDIVYPQCGK